MDTATPTRDIPTQSDVAAKVEPRTTQGNFALTPPHAPTAMGITKRDGRREAVDVGKIVRAVQRCSDGLDDIDPMRVALKTIAGIYDGATTRELDELSIRTAAAFTADEPQYARLAARLLSAYIDKEVTGQGIHSFSQSISLGVEQGLINDRLRQVVEANARKFNDAIDVEQTKRFEYFGLRTLYDRYLLRHPTRRTVIETPQQFFMRIAVSLTESAGEALELYRLMSSLDYIPSSPTLFNSGTRHEQLSSCFLLDSPKDSLADIYARYADVAQLSKFSGGIGQAYSRIRSRGGLIRGTNGRSNGIVPWLKTLDASVAAVNQGGKRKGAACIYLETWHADIEEFLELRDNTGDEMRRTHNLNLANWVPDLFMRRVEEDGDWSLFDPSALPELVDLWGEEFDRAFQQAEKQGLATRTIKARDLYARMMKVLGETGNGWMTFKDASNRTCNQVGPGRTVHLSNLCTEILEVTSAEETAVCNLGSINLARHVVEDERGAARFDFDKLAETVRVAVRQLDRVIDLNFYPIESARRSNMRWRPVGLGVMGLQDVFFRLRLPFDSTEALTLSTRIAERVYLHALETSCEIAEERGAHPAFADTRAARGDLQFDLWGVVPTEVAAWEALKPRIAQHGLRNSLLIAIAPTATIASIAGCYECIEPQVSNLFKRETLSGDFLQVNRYLVDELKRLGLWTEATRDAIKMAEGSVQGINGIPDVLKLVYRTAWELPQKALIDLAAARGAYIDQSQSLNLFMESPNIGRLSSMYMYAWKSGLKTTYYLRSRPATRIAKATVHVQSAYTPQEALACSLENPEACEACQ
ncbi:ribonucleoside-diphosphate reductase subunit alpha [Solilutibacter tolerans]|uniref:Ribonucleoside-diphosphate reductase n=1 Tax=Solilutibacter tolerans TaxID=1604334 RepID=A0A1N6NEZ9_9GAMM|nr:ribonucleoside-diphosphate reductase subunit alpha [Lysobacter tolerans]SIP90566.1 ribonucleoside-diphosphate reductase alpha chain [Lysobacter tolerans]